MGAHIGFIRYIAYLFLIIELPPGDFVTAYVAGLELRGELVSAEDVQNLKARYGVGEPGWIRGILRVDLGRSFQ